MSVIFAYITTRDREEALRIGRALVEGHVAACVNVLDGMTSVYRWEGRLEEATEAVLLVKTGKDRVPDLISMVKKLHSYSLPCIATWPITDGNPEYLSWIREESRHG